jgi:peptide/nickel transport system substrate-binding protein
MGVGRTFAALAVIATTATLAACVAQPVVVENSTVAVAVSAPFTSYNPATTFGATAVNEELAYATNSNFFSYDNRQRLVADTSFGSVEQLSASPLTVKYTIRDGVTWSDGTDVDAADLLLAWAAGSGAFNTPGFDVRKYRSPRGVLSPKLPKDAVWFDTEGRSGLRNVTALPVIGDDDRSITLSYATYFVDWQQAFAVGLPAHVVAREALGIPSAAKAKDAVVDAIEAHDSATLASLSRSSNTAFNLSRGAIDPALLVGDGPYSVQKVAGTAVTLRANRRYTGDHAPQFETVVVRVIPTAKAQLAALGTGAVDVITPPATAATATALLQLPKVTVATGYDGGFEHLDLQFAQGRNGAFDDPRIRRAFLKVVPRQQIVDGVAGAVQEEAVPRSSFVFFPETDAYDAAVAGNGSAAYDVVDVPGARALLAAAGERAPTVCILFDPANPQRVAEFRLIRTSAARAGFSVTNCSRADWESRLGVKGAYDASLFTWRSTSAAVTEVTGRLHSGAAENYNHYANPATDALLTTLAQTSEPAAQNELLTEIDHRLFADDYGLPLYQLPALTAFRTTVAGVSRSPFSPGVFWNIWDWRPAS